MATLRNVSELLLTSFDDGNISEDELSCMMSTDLNIRIFPTRITNVLTSRGLTKVNA